MILISLFIVGIDRRQEGRRQEGRRQEGRRQEGRRQEGRRQVVQIKSWLSPDSTIEMLNHVKTLPLKEEQLFIHGKYHTTPRRVYHCGTNTGTHDYSGMKD